MRRIVKKGQYYSVYYYGNLEFKVWANDAQHALELLQDKWREYTTGIDLSVIEIYLSNTK